MTLIDHSDGPVATPGAASTAGRHWTGAEATDPWLLAADSLVPALHERAGEHDRSGEFAAHGVDLARTNGMLAALVPAELGGGGASHAAMCAALSRLAHGCPATALTLSMHSHLVAAQVWRHHRGLPAPVLETVASTQPLLVSTGASDWLGSSGEATAVDGGFRVSARKQPASGAPAGDVLVTSARWTTAPDGPQVLHFSVPFAAPGLRTELTWDTMGMRATGSHTVVLDDVFVPEAAVALMRPAGHWHPVWSTIAGAALPLIMACYVGVAEAAADRAVHLAAGRSGRADVTATVGRMVNRLTVARDVVRAMIDASDDLRFEATQEHASLSLARKTSAAEAAIDTVRLALEAGGGAAYARATGVERLFRDVHGALYHPLPAARQELFTGRCALGLDPSET